MDNILTINKEEARIVLAAMNTWEASARSDEPHGSYSIEYKEFKKAVREFLKCNVCGDDRMFHDCGLIK